MDLEEARSYLNHLLTLNLRGEESFGPLAYTFWKDHDLEKIGLLPEDRASSRSTTKASTCVFYRRCGG